MPRGDRTMMGWNGPVRGFLILSAASLGAVLGWSSSNRSAGRLEWSSLVVDANTVPGPVLEALPGLGSVLAGRIVEAREVAPFRSIDDFDLRVKGIGPAKIASLRPFLRFEMTPNPLP